MYQYFDDRFRWLVQEPELEILALITVSSLTSYPEFPSSQLLSQENSLKSYLRASLVVKGLRSYLPMQGTQV